MGVFPTFSIPDPSGSTLFKSGTFNVPVFFGVSSVSALCSISGFKVTM